MPCALKQEPAAALSLVDPVFKQARCRYVFRVIAKRVSGAHAEDQSFFVLVQLGKHVLSGYEVGVIVRNSLQPRNVTDGANCRSADFSNSLRDVVGHGKQLVSVLIEQQMIVAEVRTTHVPMEVLGFEIKAEHVCQQCIQGAGNFHNGFRFNVGRGGQGRLLALHKLRFVTASEILLLGV